MMESSFVLGDYMEAIDAIFLAVAQIRDPGHVLLTQEIRLAAWLLVFSAATLELQGEGRWERLVGVDVRQGSRRDDDFKVGS